MLLEKDITAKLNKTLGPLGFECHPFKVGWYNEQVGLPFQLAYHYDTLSFIVISTPQMFDLAFKQFVSNSLVTGIKDPIDECVSHYLHKLEKDFPQHELSIIMDHDLHPAKRRPKVLVQTAGHVAGAAFYYQKSSLSYNPWQAENKNLCGVSVHPKYGGWFALRAVVIFKDVLSPELIRVEPPDTVSCQKKRLELLEKFNFSWRDWSYRDIIPVLSRYSEEQKLYFATPPHERLQLIASFVSNGIKSCDTIDYS